VIGRWRDTWSATRWPARATGVAEDARARRADLSRQPSINALPLAIDAAASTGAANSLEKMLARHLVVTREGSLRVLNHVLS
jgi:hypothetical protein